MSLDNQLVEILNQQTQIMKALAAGQKHEKSVASIGTYTELHGDGSLFGNESVERDVITAHVRPSGLAEILPFFPSVVERPYFATITGYTGTNGAEPTNPCDDAPSGFVKGCYLTAQFGRVVRDTQTIEIDKVMLQKNRGDFTDLALRGRVLGMTPFKPGSLSEEGILKVVTKSEMVITGVNMERKLSTMTWTGTPSANTAGGGYKEFPGLDEQIATGQIDAETGTACPALDSDIKDFNYSAIDGTDKDIVTYLSMLAYYLEYNADTMGLNPVSFVIAMRPDLWHQLTEVWPCRYLTNRCATGTGTNPMVINDNVNVAMRDAMRTGKYIDINGKRYPVVTDTGIFREDSTNSANVAAGSYASDIYMIPLTITGNFPVTYFEYVDYRAAMPDIALLRGHENFWTDDGRFLWAYEDSNFCYKLKMKFEPRIVLRTPQLAGRIQNVRYSPLQMLRDVDPAGPYFADGGVSLRANSSFQAVWA